MNNKIKNQTGELVLEITEKLHVQLAALKIKASDIQVDPHQIAKVLQQAWWSPMRKEIYLLNTSDELVQFPYNLATKFLRRNFDTLVINETKLLSRIAQATKKNQIVAAQEDKMNKALKTTPWDALLAHLINNNQRKDMRVRVDMFASRSSLQLGEDVVNVTFPWHPAETDAQPDPEVMGDYREHFPFLGDFLEFLVASRFAADRKQSYLWLHCDSNWGKNLLMDQLKKLCLVTMLSVKEAEAAFEGKPVGLTVNDFKRSFALVFDEFKHVKSELKQLQNTMTLAPKFQLRTEVDIYTKLFMSKEGVASLAGDYGIEDQFANRFSYIRGRGAITDRPVFQKFPKGRYARGIEAYVCGYINERVDEYIALGREAAETEAENQIDAFTHIHGIDRYFDRFSKSLTGVAEDFGEWLLKEYTATKQASRLLEGISPTEEMVQDNLIKGHDGLYLKAPRTLFDKWVAKTICNSSRVSISMAADDVFRHLSADNRGCVRRRPYGGKCSQQVRCIKLKPQYGTVAHTPAGVAA